MWPFCLSLCVICPASGQGFSRRSHGTRKLRSSESDHACWAVEIAMNRHILEKWSHCVVTAGREPVAESLGDFEAVLGDASDERPIQQLLAASPTLLGPLVPPGGRFWCLDRPKLGAEYVPDFLLATSTSVGFKWLAVELESPMAKALTKDGLPARKLAAALGQVRDWRVWLSENVSYARGERGLKDIDGNCNAVVVIGRRSTLDPGQIKRYRALSTSGLTVMSYDRLTDTIRNSVRGSEVGHG